MLPNVRNKCLAGYIFGNHFNWTHAPIKCQVANDFYFLFIASLQNLVGMRIAKCDEEV